MNAWWEMWTGNMHPHVLLCTKATADVNKSVNMRSGRPVRSNNIRWLHISTTIICTLRQITSGLRGFCYDHWCCSNMYLGAPQQNLPFISGRDEFALLMTRETDIELGLSMPTSQLCGSVGDQHSWITPSDERDIMRIWSSQSTNMFTSKELQLSALSLTLNANDKWYWEWYLKLRSCMTSVLAHV